MSVTGGYATMSRFGGGLTAVPGTSTLDPHERARLTHRAMAVDTSHLPNDCGPMSAFGKQLESTKKNEPSFFFGRTTRAERARACNFDERSMKEALQIIEADHYARTERVVPPPGAYESEAAWDATGAVGDSWSRDGRLATGLLARDSAGRGGLTRSTRFPKKHAHDFGKAVGRENVEGLGRETQTFSGNLAARRERRFGVDAERFATADVSSFGRQVARRSSTFPHADFATTLSRRTRDGNDARRRHGGALEALARGQDAPPATKTAVVLSSMGAQALSTRATAASLSWGRSPRSPRSPAATSSAARELEARRGPGMYHRVEDFRDTLREMRETRRIARTVRLGGTYESAYEKRRMLSSTLPSVSPRGFGTERALDSRLTSSVGMLGTSPGTFRASPTSTLKHWARGAPAGTGTRGRREPRFFPQTNAELRDAYARERDMGGRHPDGSKRRLWA